MNRPHSKHGLSEPPRREETQVPVVLPHVVVDVASDGTMTVSIDGQPHEPEPFAPPWRREDFARVLDQFTDQRRSPVRVEVREADGTVFTDIITPGKRRRPDTEPPAVAVTPAVPELMVLRGEGFVSGEDVAVAVIIARGDTSPDGIMSGLLTPDQLAASPTREVILLGRVSGTVTVGHPQ
ncbi:MAG: hypothetical protein EPN48_05460 [Microbacteriaceae bacterium]|nr:MAG: hypothetical protein EPN48_05460 [Microbacteriaceae bacterium]